jgi:hypothetical protein
VSLKENGEGRRDLVCHANGGRGALGEFPVEDIFLKKKKEGGRLYGRRRHQQQQRSGHHNTTGRGT